MKTITLILLCLLPALVLAESRGLSFWHTHTGKSLSVEYKIDGQFQPEALMQIRELLADWRDGEQFDIDPDLLDALYLIQKATGSTGRFEIISAYRSPKTNEMLRAHSNGVARNSQHLLGKAIDVRLSDVDSKKLQETALRLSLGGVGYYKKSNFVHIDTGRVRSW